jgi:heat shock protein HspQ
MDQYSANFNCESDTRVQDTAAAAEKNAEFEQSCLSIIQGVDKITKELVLSYEHSTKEQTPKNNFIEPLLTELSTQTQTDDNASMPSVYSSVSALYMYHVKVNSLLWSRKRHLEYKPKIKFSLGQVVKHKLYDYRGVVVAWDIKSKVDVRNWDGLKHIKDPQDQPFYHVIPDENDCIRAFGGSRSFRYVCQDNLEVCETSSKLAVESLNPQEWRWEGLKGVYVPSDELKVSYYSVDDIQCQMIVAHTLFQFLYGEQPESDEMIVQQILQNQQVSWL